MTPAQQEKLMQALDKYLAGARTEATRIISEQYMTGRNTILDSVFGIAGRMTDPDKVWANSLVQANMDLITGVGRNYLGDVDNLTRSALTEGLSPKDIMQAFNSIGTRFESSSQVVAFDQVAKAQELGRTNEYSRLGIAMVEVVVAPDACDVCQPHNFTKEPLQGGDRPQYHIQCLCYDIPAPDDAVRAREEEIDRSCFMDKKEYEVSRGLVKDPPAGYGPSAPLSSKQVGGVKDMIVKDLTERMKLTDDEMKRLMYQLGKDNPYDAVNALVQQWASTSGDANPRSLAMQEAASREFGIPRGLSYDICKINRETVDIINSRIGDVLQKFCRAQYEATQEMFQKAGVEYVNLFRGVDEQGFRALSGKIQGNIETGWYKGAVRDATMNPLSSYAPDYNVARLFAGDHGFIQYSRVHVSEIMSMCRTGNGCLQEWEYVVLGKMRAVWEVRSKYGMNKTIEVLLAMGE